VVLTPPGDKTAVRNPVLARLTARRDHLGGTSGDSAFPVNWNAVTVSEWRVHTAGASRSALPFVPNPALFETSYCSRHA
jgi:hypothetical protein